MLNATTHNPYGIGAVELREQLGEVLERVHYQFQQYRVMRKEKPMARIVNETYMQAIEQLLDSDSAIADTLALLLDNEAMDVLEVGEREWQEGNRIPLADVLS